MTPMNRNTKILNKILGNQIQEHTKMIMHHKAGGFFFTLQG